MAACGELMENLLIRYGSKVAISSTREYTWLHEFGNYQTLWCDVCKIVVILRCTSKTLRLTFTTSGEFHGYRGEKQPSGGVIGRALNTSGVYGAWSAGLREVVDKRPQ